MSERIARIRAALEAELKPTTLDIEDQSHLHVGHAGAASGRGHYAVRISSPAFAGKRPLECHRMVYAALGSLMETDIHALSISASAEAE